MNTYTTPHTAILAITWSCAAEHIEQALPAILNATLRRQLPRSRVDENISNPLVPPTILFHSHNSHHPSPF